MGYFKIFLLSALSLLLFGGVISVHASETDGAIDVTNHTALICNNSDCSSNSRINFLVATTSPDIVVHVLDDRLTGKAWSESMGWINLNPTISGVTNTASGTLAGYAWGENIGWINFAPTRGGVIINSSGQFSGWAWGQNSGWIKFDCSTASACMQTDWRAPSVRAAALPIITFPSPATSLAENIGTSTVTVSQSATSSQTTTATIALAGTAVQGTDYTIATTNVSIPVGQTSVTIPLTIIDNPSVNTNKTIILTLTSLVNANPGTDTSETITIVDNDTASIHSSKSALNITRGSGSISDSFDVTLTSKPTSNVTVALSLSIPNLATLSSSSLTFTPDNWSIPQHVTLTPINTSFEGNVTATTLNIISDSSSADTNYNNLITALSVAITNQFATVSGGGGGGTATPYCSAVAYSPWSTCASGQQTRTVLDRAPAGCALTPSQAALEQQICSALDENSTGTSTQPIIIPTPDRGITTGGGSGNNNPAAATAPTIKAKKIRYAYSDRYNINIRAKAALTSKIIGLMKKKTKYQLLDLSDKNWAKIKFGNNKIGFVFKSLIRDVY